MDEAQLLRQEWETLLAAHGELVRIYLEALGTYEAPLLALNVRAIAIQINALSRLLDLSIEDGLC